MLKECVRASARARARACACACVRARACACACVRARACACACVRVRARACAKHSFKHYLSITYITYIAYLCLGARPQPPTTPCPLLAPYLPPIDVVVVNRHRYSILNWGSQGSRPEHLRATAHEPCPIPTSLARSGAGCSPAGVWPEVCTIRKFMRSVHAHHLQPRRAVGYGWSTGFGKGKEWAVAVQRRGSRAGGGSSGSGVRYKWSQ